MKKMYASVFPITVEQMNIGIRVFAIVACNNDTKETLADIKQEWPDTHIVYSDGEGCVTALITTNNTDVNGLLDELKAIHEDTFASLDMYVGIVPTRFKVKLGTTAYFVTGGSEVLQEAPEGDPEPIWQPDTANKFASGYARPPHRPISRTTINL
jgi:hypothetical protein